MIYNFCNLIQNGRIIEYQVPSYNKESTVNLCTNINYNDRVQYYKANKIGCMYTLN